MRRTVTKNKKLSYFILTNDTTLLTNNTTPLTVDTTPLTINTAIRAKSALYTVKLDISLQTTQRIKGTEKYINTSLILRVVMVILKMQAKKIRELLIFILI